MEGSLNLNFDRSDGTTYWISNEEPPVPIQLARTPAKAVKESENQQLITPRRSRKVKVEGGFIEQRTDAWLEILKAYEAWCKLQRYSSAVIRDLEFAKAYNNKQLQISN